MESSRLKALQCPNCGAPATTDSVRCGWCRSVLTATACPACFGPLFQGMRFCPACGAAAERVQPARGAAGGQALSGSDSTRPCPRCAQPLHTVTIAGTGIDECSECGGIWLDAATFEKICSDREQQEKVLLYPAPERSLEPGTAGAGAARPGERYYVPCPECGELMYRKNFSDCSGIIVDLCKPHGIWFDRLELQRIIGFIRDGGLQKARAIQMAKLQAEQGRLKALQHEQSLDRLADHDARLYRTVSDEAPLLDMLVSFARRLL